MCLFLCSHVLFLFFYFSHFVYAFMCLYTVFSLYDEINFIIISRYCAPSTTTTVHNNCSIDSTLLLPLQTRPVMQMYE